MTLQRPLKSQLTLWKSLEKAKTRQETGIFLAEGFKVASELLKSNWGVNAFLILEEKMNHWLSFLTDISKESAAYVLTATEWRKLSQDKSPEGIMAIGALPTEADISGLPEKGHILMAYEINNPNNLGALIRSAHWFGFAAILLSKDSVDYTNPKVVRTSMGSLFHVSIISNMDFIEEIPKIKEHYLLVASGARRGIAPHACLQKTALLLGSESQGLPDALIEMTDEQWCVPGAGGAESLSLPQAAAIMMYEASKQNN